MAQVSSVDIRTHTHTHTHTQSHMQNCVTKISFDVLLYQLFFFAFLLHFMFASPVFYYHVMDSYKSRFFLPLCMYPPAFCFSVAFCVFWQINRFRVLLINLSSAGVGNKQQTKKHTSAMNSVALQSRFVPLNWLHSHRATNTNTRKSPEARWPIGIGQLSLRRLG